MNGVYAPVQIQKTSIDPPFFLAPMAGITHSAFRRLIAQFGGYGALTTEMLPNQTLLSENLALSPFTKRRQEEGFVIYQLVITGMESFAEALEKLLAYEPFGIDINLGCPAYMICRKGGGRALYDDVKRLKEVLQTVRSLWSGPLSVKCRLGHETADWRDTFMDRLDCFASAGVDTLTIHPRFFHEKLKRRARWDLIPWIRKQWQRPLIGNGDMVDETALELLHCGDCDGLMIGRAAVTRPWIFQELCGNEVKVDHQRVWQDFYRYTLEDFTPERAIGKVKEFTTYFAANFKFGHELFRRVQSSSDLKTLYDRAQAFFESKPQVTSRNILCAI